MWPHSIWAGRCADVRGGVRVVTSGDERGDERVSGGDKEGWTGDVLLRPAVMASWTWLG